MAPAARAVLEDVLSALGRDDMLTRKDALPSLKGHEARTLAEAMLPSAFRSASAAQTGSAQKLQIAAAH